MAEKKNTTASSSVGAKTRTLTYSKYVKDEESRIRQGIVDKKVGLSPMS